MYHSGYFEYRLCVNNDIHKTVTHECLNKNLLQLADGSGTKRNVHGLCGGVHGVCGVVVEAKLKLPPGLTCTQCLLQWRYRTGITRTLFCLSIVITTMVG